MQRMKLFILISALVSISQQSSDYSLPKESVPHHYKLKFTPYAIPDKFTFDGEAEILLSVLTSTRSLTLHSVNLIIYEEETFLIQNNRTIQPLVHNFEEDTQFLTLKFQDNLEPGNYSLHFKYTGLLNEGPTGIFWNSYANENNETIYLVATHFGLSAARFAFPCWDEPALKATFDISVKHFRNYTALSNMPVESTIDETEVDGYKWTKFETSLPMSTYSVAFTVSEFINDTVPETNISFWHRRDRNVSEYLFEVALETVRLVENYTEIQNPLPKLDIFMISEETYASTGSWGLTIMFKFASMESDETADIRSLDLIYTIVHQWVENLVSPASWHDLWITEGLRTYLTIFFSEKIYKIPGHFEHYLLTIHGNLDRYFSHVLRPLLNFRHVDIANEDKLFYNIDFVNEESALLLHMLRHLLPESVFDKAVQTMLQQNMFGTISTEEFWNILNKTATESKQSLIDYDIKTVVESYIKQAGYPVVNVKRNYTTGTITLTTTCEICRASNKSESQFWIPINFATQSSPDFNSTLPTHWIKPNDTELIIEGVDPNDWVIFNIQNTGYYRVNYDNATWNQILKYLNSKDFSTIHVSNRRKLIFELFSITKLMTHMYTKVFKNIVPYLNLEKDYISWYNMYNNFFGVYIASDDDKEYKTLTSSPTENIVQISNDLLKNHSGISKLLIKEKQQQFECLLSDPCSEEWRKIRFEFHNGPNSSSLE